jgi:hypothetical protein
MFTRLSDVLKRIFDIAQQLGIVDLAVVILVGILYWTLTVRNAGHPR